MAEVEDDSEVKRISLRQVGVAGILIPLIYIFFGTPPAPVHENREVTILVEAPSLTELLDDSTAIDYLVRAGVKGIILQPSTMEGLLEGKEATMASGAEILRLFRMEGIVNIYMWEQIKDKPLRADATYVFTNQLLLFQTFLTALTEQLGDENVRAYKDAHHDFGGDLPDNYIIEVLATEDELKSIALGLDKAYQEKLNTTGLTAIMEVKSPGAVNAIPAKTKAIFISDSSAAAAAYATLSPKLVFLAPGVPNPGWKNAVIARRILSRDSRPEPGSAIIASPSQILGLISDLKKRGYAIGEDLIMTSDAAPRGEVPSLVVRPHFLSWPAHLLLLAGGIFFLYQILAPLEPQRRSVIAVAGPLVAGVALIISDHGALYPEIFGGAILMIFVMRFVASLELPSLEITAWEAGLSVVYLLLAGELIAVGRSSLLPWHYSVLAIALYFTLETQAVNNRFLITALALALSFLLPASSVFLCGGVLVMAIFIVTAQSSSLNKAIVVLILPATLSLLVNRELALLERVIIGSWITICLLVIYFMKRLGRTAHFWRL